MPLTRIKNTAIGDDGITTQKLDDTTGGFTLPGQQFVRVPIGTTAQRPSGANGYLRFNTNIGVLEQWNANTNSWAAVDSPPIITTVSYPGSVTAADPAGGETITLTGQNFQTGATVTIGGTSATSVTVVSATSITFTTPVKTAGDYDVVVTNSNGLSATSSNGISYNGTPSFTTAAGNVGSVAEDQAMSTITIVAAEPDGGTLAYSITSGALPTGVSMSSAGAITGTPNVNPTANTTYNFTVTATDDESQTNSRAFNLIVLRPIYSTLIANSLRFDYGSSSHLTRAVSGAPTLGTKGTVSAWIKRTTVQNGTGNNQYWFHVGTGTDNSGHMDLKFQTNDSFNIGRYSDTPYDGGSHYYKDTSDWMHFVVSFDSTSGTASDRQMKIYVNGVQRTDGTFGAIGQNDVFPFTKNGNTIFVGKHATVGRPFDGYIADFHLIDGQALTPTSFAEEFNGVWCPIAYSGTYGNNGFHLEFANSSELGKDTSQDYTLVTGGSTTYGGGTTNYTSEANVFDGDVSTYVDRAASTGIIEITPASAVTPIFHSITTAPSAAYTAASRPQNVQLEGSNDGGSTWTVIDTITQTTAGIQKETSSTFTNSTSYARLRLNITSNNGGSNTRFSEYKIISSETGGGLGLNNLTSSGLSTQDSVPDSPTINFSTLNYNRRYYDWVAQGQDVDLSAGALFGSVPSAGAAIDSTMGVNSGKWYWEIRYVSGNFYHGVGLGRMGKSGAIQKYRMGANGAVNQFAVQNHGNDAAGTSLASNTFTNGSNDVHGVALDIDNLTLKFYVNGTLVHTENNIYDPKTDNDFYTAAFSNAAAGTFMYNFGQDPTFDGRNTAPSTPKTDANGRGKFFHDVPSGHLALCAANLAESAIDTTLDDRPEDYMNTILYTGDGNDNRQITGLGFKPDLVWTKTRNAARVHGLFDSVRGGLGLLQPNATDAESAGTYGVSSFDSDGFTIENDTVWNFNKNTETAVAWCWKAGGAPTASNSATSGAMTANSVSLNGTLQSAYTPSGSPTLYPTKMSVNTKAGFSIVGWTGDGTAGRTIPHGLDAKPEFFILRGRDARAWATYHEQYMGYPNTGNYYAQLNGGYPQVDNAMFNSSAPDADVFTVGSYNVVNNVNYIGYFWHSIPGYSHMGDWKNVGEALGTYVYCGFKPAWIIIRESSSAGENWYIQDNKRSPYNYATGAGKFLMPDVPNVEGPHSATTAAIDFVANGFKIRTSNAGSGEISYSTRKYSYMAFAEDPFKYAEAR